MHSVFLCSLLCFKFKNHSDFVSSKKTHHVYMYCEIIQFRGHEITWFDDIGHVHGHLNLWISNFIQMYNIAKVNNYLVRIFNLCIALPTKYTKLNVQWNFWFHSIVLLNLFFHFSIPSTDKDLRKALNMVIKLKVFQKHQTKTHYK